MRGQGALEYMIIIAAVLGISAVVVLFITGVFTGSTGGADLSKCRLAAANCQRDLTLGLGTSCMQCEAACKGASGKDLLDGTTGACGLACQQCKQGTPVGGGSGPSIGLVGYLGFEDNARILFKDGSGNANDGTYSGEVFNDGTLTNEPAWASGTQGTAVRVDGLNDYVAVRDVPSLKYTGGDMTLMAWINADPYEADGGWVFSKPWNGNGQYNYGISFWGTGQINFRVFGTSYSEITTTATVPKGSWHHVAATIQSSGAMKIYIDGIERASGLSTQPGWSPSSGDLNLNLAIGTLYPYGSGWAGASSHAFNGTIDSARLWTRALTQAEVQAEMSSPRPVIRPFADWELEENTGLVANDTHIRVAGKSGVALSFDGIDDALQIPDSSTLEPRNVSVSVWAKNTLTPATTTYDQLILSKDTTSYTSTGYALTWGWGDDFYWRAGNGATQNLVTMTLSRGAWHHLVGTFRNGEQKLYVDGVLINTNTLTFEIPYNAFPLSIGKVGTYRLQGVIDEVRIYNRILSQDEVTALYNLK